MQGKKYCELSAADSEISKMYTAACDADYEATSFWSFYYVLYVQFQDYISCSEGIFTDLDFLIEYRDEYLGSAIVLSQVFAIMFLL